MSTELLDPTFADLHGVRDTHVVLFTKESLAMGMISMKKTSFDEDKWIDVNILKDADWMLAIQEHPERLYNKPFELSLKKRWSLHRVTHLISHAGFKKEFPQPNEEENNKPSDEEISSVSEEVVVEEIQALTPKRVVGKTSNLFEAAISF